MPTDFLQTVIANNTIEHYVVFLAISIGAFLIFKIILSLGLHKLHKMAEKTVSKLDDLIVGTLKDLQWPVFILILLLTAKNSLVMSETISHIAEVVIVAIVTYQIVRIAILFANYSTEKILNKKDARSNKAQIIILNKAVNVIIWIVGLTLFLSNIGYDVNSIIAGLGIGSLAVALAVQNILSDILSSISIYLDKPFQIGDAIQIDEDRGTVMNIGIKTTRIKTLQGEELVVPNNMITNKKLHNFGKLQQRRNLVNFGIRYQTSTEKLKKIKEIITDLFKTIEDADLDRIHFASFGESGLQFELTYFVLSSDYLIFMDIQEQVNLRIKQAFEKEKIEFAYPTQTIHLEK